MNWYYALGGAQHGPVSPAQMEGLLANGTIDGATLVWNATMTEWRALNTTPLAQSGMPPPGAQRCVINGRVYPVSEMLQTEHGWVSAEARDQYYQSLREGVWPAAAGGAVSAWRDGKSFVIPVNDAVLPSRCVKTNAPVPPELVRRVDLYWAHWAIFLTIPFGWLITLILYLVMRKRVRIAMPVSAPARSAARWASAGATLLIVGGLVALFAGFVGFESFSGGWLSLAGLLVTVGGVVLGLRKGRLLYVRKVREGRAWIGGAHPDFLAALPEYHG